MSEKKNIARKLAGWAVVALFAALPLVAAAEAEVKRIPTRPGVHTPLYWDAAANAQATVLLLPGGAGGFGRIVDGRPTSNNFLVRSAHHFRANGFNVAIFGRPSDTPDLDYAIRISDAHMADIRAVIDHLKTLNTAPIWLAGTSRGTISATAAAIRLKDAGIAGIVLSSSVVSYSKVGAVPSQDLAAVTVPVLVLHHAKDSCRVTLPHEVRHILDGLTHAPVKKVVMVDGGANPSGDPCEAMHWHGYVGMEEEAVNIIGNWIRNPLP
jgi:pimeloyl-ACP methyl ester carboxylesterase